MTQYGYQFATWFFENFFRFFTGWRIPGTKMSPAAFFLFTSFIGLVLRFLIQVINRQRGPSSSSFTGFIRRNNKD